MASLCCSTTTIIFSEKFSPRIRTHTQFLTPNRLKTQKQRITERRSLIVGSIIEDREAIDVKKTNTFDPQEEEPKGDRDTDRLMSRGINTAIVLAAGTVAVTKLLSIDHDYWHVSFSVKSFFSFYGFISLLFLFRVGLCTRYLGTHLNTTGLRMSKSSKQTLF